MPSIRARSGAISGSMPGLCTGRSTRIRRTETPSRRNSASSASTASGEPETAALVGLLTTATAACAAYGASRGSSSSSGRSTEIMAPAAASRSSRCERATTTRAASSSDSAPATQAAATSPRLCPTTAAGRMPSPSQTCASETWRANSTGCWKSISSYLARSAGAASRSSTEGPPAARTASSHARIQVRNPVWERSSSRPMPTHWVPPPENTSATRRSAPPDTVPVRSSGCGCPAATRASPSRTSCRERASSAIRWLWWLRRAASV